MLQPIPRSYRSPSTAPRRPQQRTAPPTSAPKPAPPVAASEPGLLDRLISWLKRWLGITPPPPAPPVPTSPSAINSYFTDTYNKGRALNEASARANPDNPDKHLIALLDSASQSIEAAVYEIEASGVIDALVRAAQRGVRVRIVTDDQTAKDHLDPASEHSGIKRLREAGIGIVTDDRHAFMHNKFLVVDRQSVWTGSMNWTENGFYRNNNDVLRLDSRELAANYQAEFEEMYRDRRFGKTSPPGSPNPVVQIGSARVESLFAGEDKVMERLIREVQQAKSSVRFLSFSFTDDRLGEAMVAKHQQGLRVEGVLERVGARSPYGEYQRLLGAGVDVQLDGNDAIMHHKLIVLDAETDHPTIITGSFNFSKNADEHNDENVLIIKGDKELAKRYLAQYERVKRQALAA